MAARRRNREENTLARARVAPHVSRGGQPPLSAEAPVTLVVNDRELATLLCTPADLRELTVGWLFAEGLIDSSAEIVSLAGCANEREMLVRTEPDRTAELGERWRLVTSGCGAGANPGALRAEGVPRVGSGLRLGLPRLRELAREMLRGAAMYKQTGGVHAAALVSASGILVQREDIGRHNAVDKAIGHALLAGLRLDECALVSTGRLSSEMAWKAARAGLEIAASISIPSTLAKQIAEAAGQTLVGRIASREPWVYTHAERVAE
ncbi:MAG: formate dehydrogenase accessory sulfurtransferase FdhD [Chloroflexi bacterium]|nr:formate dehydrogenase accessory sulfurtransferase FdhD [Chloroflexota bacterium]MCL5110067.1 formate dehydrogenase accessory sulfurtransferase FdhD [Chloroflexota bacterium]